MSSEEEEEGKGLEDGNEGPRHMEEGRESEFPNHSYEDSVYSGNQSLGSDDKSSRKSYSSHANRSGRSYYSDDSQSRLDQSYNSEDRSTGSFHSDRSGGSYYSNEGEDLQQKSEHSYYSEDRSAKSYQSQLQDHSDQSQSHLDQSYNSEDRSAGSLRSERSRGSHYSDDPSKRSGSYFSDDHSERSGGSYYSGDHSQQSGRSYYSGDHSERSKGSYYSPGDGSERSGGSYHSGGGSGRSGHSYYSKEGKDLPQRTDHSHYSEDQSVKSYSSQERGRASLHSSKSSVKSGHSYRSGEKSVQSGSGNSRRSFSSHAGRSEGSFYSGNGQSQSGQSYNSQSQLDQSYDSEDRSVAHGGKSVHSGDGNSRRSSFSDVGRSERSHYSDESQSYLDQSYNSEDRSVGPLQSERSGGSHYSGHHSDRSGGSYYSHDHSERPPGSHYSGDHSERSGGSFYSDEEKDLPQSSEHSHYSDNTSSESCTPSSPEFQGSSPHSEDGSVNSDPSHRSPLHSSRPNEESERSRNIEDKYDNENNYERSKEHFYPEDYSDPHFFEDISTYPQQRSSEKDSDLHLTNVGSDHMGNHSVNDAQNKEANASFLGSETSPNDGRLSDPVGLSKGKAGDNSYGDEERCDSSGSICGDDFDPGRSTSSANPSKHAGRINSATGGSEDPVSSEANFPDEHSNGPTDAENVEPKISLQDDSVSSHSEHSDFMRSDGLGLNIENEKSDPIQSDGDGYDSPTKSDSLGHADQDVFRGPSTSSGVGFMGDVDSSTGADFFGDHSDGTSNGEINRETATVSSSQKEWSDEQYREAEHIESVILGAEHIEPEGEAEEVLSHGESHNGPGWLQSADGAVVSIRNSPFNEEDKKEGLRGPNISEIDSEEPSGSDFSDDINAADKGTTNSNHVGWLSEVSFLHLALEGEGLKNVEGWFGCSDPFYEVAAFVVEDLSNNKGSWQTVYRSEFLENNLNPAWQPAEICLDFLCGGNPTKAIRISVFDWEESDKHNKMGFFDTCVDDILNSSGDRSKCFTLSHRGANYGKIVVVEAHVDRKANSSNELPVSKQDSILRLILEGKGMANVEGWFGCSDPFFTISSSNKDPCGSQLTWQIVYESEHIENNLDPKWKPAEISLVSPQADPWRPVRISVFDWEENGKHKPMGFFDTTIGALLVEAGDGSKSFTLADTEGSLYGKVIVVYGQIDALPSQEQQVQPGSDVTHEDMHHCCSNGALGSYSSNEETQGDVDGTKLSLHHTGNADGNASHSTDDSFSGELTVERSGVVTSAGLVRINSSHEAGKAKSDEEQNDGFGDSHPSKNNGDVLSNDGQRSSIVSRSGKDDDEDRAFDDIDDDNEEKELVGQAVVKHSLNSGGSYGYPAEDRIQTENMENSGVYNVEYSGEHDDRHAQSFTCSVRRSIVSDDRVGPIDAEQNKNSDQPDLAAIAPGDGDINNETGPGRSSNSVSSMRDIYDREEDGTYQGHSEDRPISDDYKESEEIPSRLNISAIDSQIVGSEVDDDFSARNESAALPIDEKEVDSFNEDEDIASRGPYISEVDSQDVSDSSFGDVNESVKRLSTSSKSSIISILENGPSDPEQIGGENYKSDAGPDHDSISGPSRPNLARESVYSDEKCVTQDIRLDSGVVDAEHEGSGLSGHSLESEGKSASSDSMHSQARSEQPLGSDAISMTSCSPGSKDEGGVDDEIDNISEQREGQLRLYDDSAGVLTLSEGKGTKTNDGLFLGGRPENSTWVDEDGTSSTAGKVQDAASDTGVSDTAGSDSNHQEILEGDITNIDGISTTLNHPDQEGEQLYQASEDDDNLMEQGREDEFSDHSYENSANSETRSLGSGSRGSRRSSSSHAEGSYYSNECQSGLDQSYNSEEDRSAGSFQSDKSGDSNYSNQDSQSSQMSQGHDGSDQVLYKSGGSNQGSYRSSDLSQRSEGSYCSEDRSVKSYSSHSKDGFVSSHHDPDKRSTHSGQSYSSHERPGDSYISNMDKDLAPKSEHSYCSGDKSVKSYGSQDGQQALPHSKHNSVQSDSSFQSDERSLQSSNSGSKKSFSSHVEQSERSNCSKDSQLRLDHSFNSEDRSSGPLYSERSSGSYSNQDGSSGAMSHGSNDLQQMSFRSHDSGQTSYISGGSDQRSYRSNDLSQRSEGFYHSENRSARSFRSHEASERSQHSKQSSSGRTGDLHYLEDDHSGSHQIADDSTYSQQHSVDFDRHLLDVGDDQVAAEDEGEHRILAQEDEWADDALHGDNDAAGKKGAGIDLDRLGDGDLDHPNARSQTSDGSSDSMKTNETNVQPELDSTPFSDDVDDKGVLRGPTIREVDSQEAWKSDFDNVSRENSRLEIDRASESKEKVSNRNNENSMLREQISVLEAALQEKNDLLNLANEESSNLSLQKSALEIELGHNKEQIKNLSARKNELEDSLLQTKSELSEYREELTESQAEISSLKEELMRAEKLLSSKATITDPAKVIDSQIHERVCKEKAALELSLSQSRQEVEEARLELDRSRIESSKLEGEKENLQRRVLELENDAQVSEVKRSSVSQTSATVDPNSEALREAQTKIMKYEDRIEADASALKKATKDNELLTKQAAKYKSVAEKNAITVKEAKNLLTKYKEDRQKQLDAKAALTKEVKAKLAESKQKVRQIEDSLKAKDDTINLLKDEREKLKSENASLDSEIEKLLSENKSLENSLDDADVEIQRLKTERSSATKDGPSEDKMADLEAEIQDLTAELADASEQLASLKEQLENTESELSEQREVVAQLEEENEELANQGDDADKVAELEAYITELEEENEELSNRAEGGEKNESTKVAELEATIAELEDENEELANKTNDEDSSRVAELEAIIAELKEENAQLAKQRGDSDAGSSTKIAELEARIAELEAENEELANNDDNNEKIAELEATIADLEEENEELANRDGDGDENGSKVAELEATIADLEAEIEDLANQGGDAEKVAELEATIADLEDENEQLAKQTIDNEKLSELEKEKISLMKKVKQLEKSLKGATEQVEQAMTAKELYTDMWKDAKNEMSKMQKIYGVVPGKKSKKINRRG